MNEMWLDSLSETHVRVDTPRGRGHTRLYEEQERKDAVPLTSGKQLARFGLGNATDAELRDAFNRMDLDGGGTLDADEIAEAMRGMGESERDVQKTISAMPAAALSFGQFKGMTKRDRTHADVKAYNGKLNRMQFVQRLVLENNMLRTILAVLLYIPMVAFYISALLTYDPFEYVTVCTVLSDYDTFSGCRLITGMHKTVMTGFDLASLTDNPVNNREDLYLFMGLHMD